MKYVYREYKHVFDTPAKMEQESVIVSKIMDLLNKNKYDNIYEFINKNQTYQFFLKNNQLENVVKHFGNTLNEEDFRRIQSTIVKLTEQKKSFEKDEIKTTNIDDKEYTTYQGQDKMFFLDNSHSNMSIERQMEELQPTEQKFQTSDTKENTENMMNELEKNKKEVLNLQYLKDIDIEKLNSKEKSIFNEVANYQLSISHPLRIDLEKEVIVDELGNISKIKFENGEFVITGPDNQEKEISKDNVQKEETKTFQKTLVPSPNTIYSNNN